MGGAITSASLVEGQEGHSGQKKQHMQRPTLSTAGCKKQGSLGRRLWGLVGACVSLVSRTAFILRATGDMVGSEARDKISRRGRKWPLAETASAWPQCLQLPHAAPSQGSAGHCALFYEAGGL